jgi:hypothetical protein
MVSNEVAKETRMSAPPPLVEQPVRSFKMWPASADQIPFGEIILPGLWKRMHDEGTFEMFFHDLPDLTFGQFVRCLSEPGEQVHIVCEMDGENIIDTAAIAMVTDIRITENVKRGLGNFLMMKAYWGHEQSDRIGSIILDAWFKELNVVVGVTPELNRHALSYVQHMGFQVVGSIPLFSSYHGALCAGIVTCQTRSEWMEHREELRG